MCNHSMNSVLIIWDISSEKRWTNPQNRWCVFTYSAKAFSKKTTTKNKTEKNNPETILTKNPALTQQQLNPHTNSSLKATDYKLHNCEVLWPDSRSSLLSKEIAQELNPKLMEVLKMML